LDKTANQTRVSFSELNKVPRKILGGAMYTNNLVLSLGTSLRNERKGDLRIQSRPFCAMLALSCLLLFTAATGSAQQNNTINTVAGQAPFNAVALQMAIPNPTSVAEDASGNIYIASQYSYYVYKLNPSTGTLSVVAGTGIFGFGSDAIPATSSPLSSAVAVAVDAAANVYIIDGDRIRVVNTQSSPITVLGVTIQPGNVATVADTNGTNCPNASSGPPSCGDGEPAAQAQFFAPQAIYIDGSGNLFIADTNDEEIRFINTQSTAVTVTGVTVQPGNVATVAGNGVTCNGPSVPCGDGGLAIAPGAKGAKLDLPLGVVTDKAGNLYIGDTRDQRIRCVANVAGGCPNTQYLNTTVGEIVAYASSGPICPAPTSSCGDNGPKLNGRFHNPSGIWLDSLGDLYVADQWDNRIREVTPGANGIISTVCGTGTAGYEDGICPRGVEFYGPLAIIMDAAGNVTIADSGNGLIRQGKVSTRTVKTIAGSGLVGDGGPATAASFANPVDVAWDASGTNFYIVDNGNNRIREVTANGTISTVVGTGHPSQTGSIGDNGPATAATLSNPNGVALDVNGNIYIADSTNSVVRVVNMQSTTLTVGLVQVPPGDIATIAGNSGFGGCEPSNGQCGDGDAATGPDVRMDYPISVAVDGSGNVYISDYFDSRVRCVVNVTGGCPNTKYPTPQVGWIVTYAGTGVAGHFGNGGAADTALLNAPFGIAADSAGDLQIADSLNNEVRCVMGMAGGCDGEKLPVATIFDYAFNGMPKFGGDGGPALSASMNVPQGIGLDPAGNLYVGGGGDSVVQRIDASTRIVITVAGNPSHPGNIGFGGDGGLAPLATLDNLGLSVNGAEELLIADQGNNRIRQVDMVPTANLWEAKLDFPNTPVGQTSGPMTIKLQNAGLASLPISSTQLGGTDPGDFGISSNSCLTQLPPESFCYVGVTFTPTQTGQRTATVTINTSLGPQVVNLLGTGE
jgi:sugar lactone lactonase YvrE